MSQMRGNNYATAGGAALEPDRFNINESVFILDATAGQRYDAYDGRQELNAPRTHARKQGISVTMALRIFAGLLAAFFIFWIIGQVHIHQMAHEVSLLEETVNELHQKITSLDEEILKARDMTVISDKAVKELGMVPIDEIEVRWVSAPDVRPFAARGDTLHENTD